MSSVKTIAELYELDQADDSVTPRVRGAMFRARARQSGLTADRLRGAFESLGLRSVDLNDDASLGAALGAARSIGGVGSAAGADRSRWGGGRKSIDRRGREDWGLFRVVTASGSTGAEVGWEMEFESPVEDLVLYLWDPEQLLVEGYITEMKVGKMPLTLSPTKNFEFIPCVVLDVEDSLGDQREFGGIYLGDVPINTKISGKIYIPTSTVDVTWGWNGRCGLAQPALEALRTGQAG